MMRVLALGGAGGMGGFAVNTLMKLNFCSEIIIADINGDLAEAVSNECGSGTSWRIVDVSDTVSLRTAMKGADVIMNTVGPFYRYGVSILETAIECGCHYFDINDDWEPTVNMLALHQKAQNAGITAITGMGATPGISNMLAVKAIRELDEATEIFTGWNLDSAKPETIGPKPSAATIHGIHQLTGKICIFDNGRFQNVRPRQGVMLDYPGIGKNRAWTIGHPEAVTLPRYFPSLQRSINVFTATQFNILGIKTLAMLVDLKIISIETAARIAEKANGLHNPENSSGRMLKKMIHQGFSDFPPLFVCVKGIKNNKPATSACMILTAPDGGMAGATGVPLAVAISLLHENRINRHGVFAPEGILVPDAFFAKLAPLCEPPKAGVNDMILTTRSWEPVKVAETLLG